MKEYLINDDIAKWLEEHNLDVNELLTKLMDDWDYFSGELV